MRGAVAKKIRKYVRDNYKFMPAESLYRHLPYGPIVLAETCQRALYQSMKKEYKRLQRT